MKFKKDEIKAKVKKHAPEIIIGALTVAGTVGWVLAGAYAKKLNDSFSSTLFLHPEHWDALGRGDILHVDIDGSGETYFAVHDRSECDSTR